jgi:hypothetical protein
MAASAGLFGGYLALRRPREGRRPGTGTGWGEVR